MKYSGNCSSKVRDDRSTLQEAAKKGNLPMVQLLVQHGANPRFCNVLGHTVLAFAVKHRHPKVVDYLLSVGVDPSYSMTPSAKTESYIFLPTLQCPNL